MKNKAKSSPFVRNCPSLSAGFDAEGSSSGRMVQPRAAVFDELAMDSLWEEVIERCSDLLLMRPDCTLLLVRRAQVSDSIDNVSTSKADLTKE